ncbi:hypothetical protein LTR70_004860 [Exophiala xenobiotica]|uniref:Uncharacterized protein n=1 Tax=Lithohypha guttulata TaxID=1690604 RepID=A0ABR0KBV9_9EURO|nr:hypothetical protein LTR24_004478 [Lithohypha guttulata]KAK5319815.1 hypothetical protein LTR70_004860 [Exophiala xenobiotica]
MGFRNDIKAGVKKLSWTSLKKKLTRSDKYVDVTSPETAVGVESTPLTLPPRLVHASPSPSPSPPSRPTSRVPAGLTWATRRSAPVPAVVGTSRLDPKSNSPQPTSSPGSGPKCQKEHAPSMTEAEPEEIKDNEPSSSGHDGPIAQVFAKRGRSQLEATIQGLSEQGNAFPSDHEGSFAPALPSSMAVVGRKQVPRPLEHHVWFKDVAAVDDSLHVQGPRESRQSATITSPKARKASSNNSTNFFVNHKLIEQVTKRAEPATSLSAIPSPSFLILPSAPPLLGRLLSGLSPESLAPQQAVYKYATSERATPSISAPHSGAQVRPSIGSSSSDSDAPQTEATTAKKDPAVLQVVRPWTALKQLVWSRATVVRENGELVQELNILGQQNEAGSQLVETLLALNNGLNAQFDVSQRDVAVLTYQLQQAQLQHAGTLATLQQAINELRMERAASAYLQSHVDELARQRSLMQELVQRQAEEAISLQTQVVDLTRQRNTLQQEKGFAEEDGARWQRHCEEAEEERDALEQEKESAETDAAQWKERCEEAEDNAEDCLLKLNRLREEPASSDRFRKGKSAKPAPNHFAPPESDSESEEELPTPEELYAERAQNKARFTSYQNHVEELEEELAAANERVRELEGHRHDADSTGGQQGYDAEDDLHASNPRTLQDAHQCIAHLRERVEETEKQRAPLAAWIEDLDKALAESEAKRKTGLEYIELLQTCEARKNVCQHAQQAISLLRRKQELREQKDAAYMKLEEDHNELKRFQDRTLCDLMASEIEKDGLATQYKDLRTDNKRLFNDNKTLKALLNHRVFGADGQMAHERMATYRERIRDLEQGIDARNARIRDLVAESKYFLDRDERFGKGGIVQTLEEKVASTNINRLKYEAIVKAMEARFERDLRREKVEVDLRPAETEFTNEQEVQKRELRRVNADFYTLKDAEITKDDEEWWLM